MPASADLDVAYGVYRETGQDTELFDAMLRYARYLCRIKSPRTDETVADEAAEQAFLSMSEYDGRSKFSTWVYQIVVNYLVDGSRDFARIPPSMELKEHIALDNTLDFANCRVLLLGLLKQLEPADKALLMLVLRGHSQEDIAKKLRIAQQTVSVRWDKIKTALSEHLRSKR